MRFKEQESEYTVALTRHLDSVRLIRLGAADDLEEKPESVAHADVVEHPSRSTFRRLPSAGLQGLVGGERLEP